MEKLREEILSLEKSCKLAQNELQKIYDGRKECCIREYIKNNVKQGDIFYMYYKHPYRETKVEFIEIQGSEMVLREVQDRYEIRTSISDFIKLVRGTV